MTLPRAPGAAGLFCRGSADGRSGYELLVSREGRWRIDRVEEGRRRRLGGGVVSTETVPPGQSTLLRFLCGAGRPGANVTLGFTINATPFQFVADPRSYAPGTPGEAGAVIAGGGPVTSEAVFEGLALSLAR